MKLGRLLVALPLVAGLSIAGATMASAQGVQAFAALFGGNETPPNASPGYGAVALTFHGTGTVCFGIVVDRMGSRTLHISIRAELVTLTLPRWF